MSAAPPLGRSWCPALKPGAVLRWDEIRETDLLVMPERAVILNATGAAILGLCDGRRRVDAVIGECGRRFKDGFVADDVVEFLEAFRTRGWLV
jgi:pyrroloquinoline quinone biosynthesis protein D